MWCFLSKLGKAGQWDWCQPGYHFSIIEEVVDNCFIFRLIFHILSCFDTGLNWDLAYVSLDLCLYVMFFMTALLNQCVQINSQFMCWTVYYGFGFFHIFLIVQPVNKGTQLINISKYKTNCTHYWYIYN